LVLTNGGTGASRSVLRQHAARQRFCQAKAANTPNSTRARPNHVKAYEKWLFGNVRTVVPRFGQPPGTGHHDRHAAEKAKDNASASPAQGHRSRGIARSPRASLNL